MKRSGIQRIPAESSRRKGFRCAGVRCGIKTRAGAPDLGLILSERPAVAAAVFTTNRVQAAPVLFDRELLKRGPVRGVVVNAGNANACTGSKGLRDARRMSELAAECAGAAADVPRRQHRHHRRPAPARRKSNRASGRPRRASAGLRRTQTPSLARS